jgi:hypothetical protein
MFQTVWSIRILQFLACFGFLICSFEFLSPQGIQFARRYGYFGKNPLTFASLP